MFSPRVFAAMVLLAVCVDSASTAADHTAERDVDCDNLLLRSKYDKLSKTYDKIKEQTKKTIKDAKKRSKAAQKHSWSSLQLPTESDPYMRLIHDTRLFTKDDLRVMVKRNFIFTAGYTRSSKFYHEYTHIDPLPRHADVSATTATLTTDGYLVVTVPIDPEAPKSLQLERMIPIVEGDSPLGNDPTQDISSEEGK